MSLKLSVGVRPSEKATQGNEVNNSQQERKGAPFNYYTYVVRMRVFFVLLL